MGLPQKPARDRVGTLDLLILSRLAKASIHRYGIADFINPVSDALHVEEGSLYLALQSLESQGLIWCAAENNRRARFYKLMRANHRGDLQQAAHCGGDQSSIEPVQP